MTALGMDSCACFILSTLPSLSHLLIHPGWARPKLPEHMAHFSLSAWPVRALVPQQMPRVLKAPHWVCGERLPLPFSVLTASTSIATSPTSPVGLSALLLRSNAYVEVTKDFFFSK